MNERYTSIDGLVGRDPVGAVVTVGTKGDNGAPTNRDRFYFKQVFAQDVGGVLRKGEHPAFAAYNSAPAEKRRTLRGNIVHASIGDCFEAGLAAQKLKGFPSHPKKIPTCCGNGKEATRYYGKLEDGTDDFRVIPCPNSLCFARIGKVKECKPAMRFLFRVNWSDGIALPKILVRLVSHSWNSAANFQGLFDYLALQAQSFGLSEFSVFGIPFAITLTEKTNPEEKSRFPVLTITPECDLQDFFVWQRRQLESFGGKLSLPAGLSDPENSAPEIIAADFADIVPGLPISKPSNTPEIIDADPVDATSTALSFESVARIRKAATDKGMDAETLDRVLGAPLEDAPAGAELEILRTVREWRKGK